MSSSSFRSHAVRAVTTLTCAVIGGLLVVAGAHCLPWPGGSLRADPTGTVLAALAGAVVAAGIRVAARRSLEYLFALHAMTATMLLYVGAAAGYLADVWRGRTRVDWPSTAADLENLAIAFLFVAVVAFCLFVYGTIVGVAVALVHVVPIAMAARHEKSGLPDAGARTMLVCAAWLALVSGCATRLTSDADLWRIGEVSGAAGAGIAALLGVLGIAWLALAPRHEAHSMV